MFQVLTFDESARTSFNMSPIHHSVRHLYIIQYVSRSLFYVTRKTRGIIYVIRILPDTSAFAQFYFIRVNRVGIHRDKHLVCGNQNNFTEDVDRDGENKAEDTEEFQTG